MVEVNSGENTQRFENVKEFILTRLESSSLDVDKACDKFSNTDEVTKIAIEHSFRTFVVQRLSKMTIPDMYSILDLSISAAQKKLCLPTTPIHLINDMLSTLTIEKCSEIFCYLEESSHIWKSELFYQSVKNYLLRMCNDLLKRLSKSQNTVFSGRIHLFLAKLFPLTEKSGLNLMSHFSDNFTRYTNNPEAFEKAINKNKSDLMETDDLDLSTHSMPIDYNLYLKFWSLQDVFCRPNTCYDKLTWKTFTNNAIDVLEALKGYKLEDVKDESGRKMDEYDDMNLYFSKYLTSEKLLDLQLNDSNFRRQILLQFLILFHYLTADVKFKSSSQVLNEEQLSWVKSASRKVTDLLKETPPHGSKFSSGVKHILEREEIWNKWKNESCPNFVKEKKSHSQSKAATKRPRPVSSDFLLKSTTNKVFLADSSLMSKLCNVNHENLEVCRDPNRQFLPSLKEFFLDAIEQLDPANQVERQYYLINQTDWAWKGLRLLAKRSPYYFMQNQNVKTVSEYLEAICGKLNKDFTAEQQAEMQNNKTETKEGEKDASPIDENEDTQGNDEEFDDEQAGSIKNENDEMVQDEEMASDVKNEIDGEPEAPKLKEKFIDCELINYVVENVGEEEKLKNLVANLTKSVSDKINVEENESIHIKYKKILQTWTELDERADLLSVLADELKSLGREDLATTVESRLK
ncbi:THO complex subunit 1 [Brachionus plicatilis]|uniref:THO complex subunit 1 n=1 Tax=Brachionus plicatilis TaxID=10195 RepID=A0A3M7S2P5_BRAPC|nr:THO complex subunit 1 [Brachionus plicatilis]